MSVKILFAHEKIKSLDGAIAHLNDCGVRSFFDERSILFIQNFSSMLLKYPGINKYPDLVALAYWFRRSNLHKLKESYHISNDFIRLGRGISLHIAPSNVDTIFVYSFFLSLLAGNSSFIRVSQNESPELNIIIKIFHDIYNSDESETAGRFVICTYPHENEATQLLSNNCELRLIWGGDETVQTITNIPLKPTALELKFPNRSSFSAIKLEAIEVMSDEDLAKLCARFYSDIQLFGQQACSSPLALYFVGPSSKKHHAERFWALFNKAAKSHNISSSEVMNRFVSAANLAITSQIKKSRSSFDSSNVVILDGQFSSKSSFREEHAGNGLLVQYYIDELFNLTEYIETKDQTLSIFGFNHKEVESFLYSLTNRGIDRVVPIGQALDFSHIWDGVDLLDVMSRKIDVSKI